MANPYPMQGQMMQPPPMGNGAAPRVVRRGTSKAVPVVVSAGLAIGVFCGLLFGVGLDDDEATASPTTHASATQTEKKTDGDVPAPFQPERKDVKVPSLAPIPVKDGSGSGSGSGSAAGTGSGSGSAATVPAAPTKVVGTLKIEIKPESATKNAKISIDGKEIEGDSYELDLTEAAKAAKPAADGKPPEVKKEVKVVVKASGYRDHTSKVEIVGERDTTLKVELVRHSSGGGLTRPPPPGGNGGNSNGGNKPKCRRPPCGLIDI